MLITTILLNLFILFIARIDSSLEMTSKELPVISREMVQEGFSLGASSVINVWEHGLRLQARERSDPNSRASPKTVVSPDSMRLMNLVPADSGHPLYHDGPVYTALRHSFLLDSFVEESISPSDSRMESESGLAVTNMNGRQLVFKKNAEGKISVNDIPVKSSQELSDGTQLYVLDGILFTYAADVPEAWKRLMKEERESGRSQCFHGEC